MSIENIEMSWDSGILAQVGIGDTEPEPDLAPYPASTHSIDDDYIYNKSSESASSEPSEGSESESDADMPTQRNTKKRGKTKKSGKVSKPNANPRKILKSKTKTRTVLRQKTLNFVSNNSASTASCSTQSSSNDLNSNSKKPAPESTGTAIQSSSNDLNSNSKKPVPESTGTVIPAPKWFEQFEKLMTYEGPVETKPDNCKFKCNKCGQCVSCHISSSGNISRHLSGKHPEIDLQAIVQKKLELQPNLQDIVDHNILVQPQLDEAVRDVVMEGMLPFSFVQLPSMQRLVLGLQAHKPYSQKLKLKKRGYFVDKMRKRMAIYKDELIELFENIKHFAATADCWKTLNKAYLGITIHWLEEKTGPDFDFEFERKSKILGCIRLKNSITFAVIAHELNKIFSEYKILEKITNVTTDNGSNFVKAFRVFGDKDLIIHEVDSSDENSNDGDEIEIIELYPTVYQGFSEDSDYWSLPPHIRCASHTLNLIMTVDMEKIFNDDLILKTTFNNCFSKLKLLWNRQNSDPIHSSSIKNTIGFLLKTPNATRWNSTFDAIDCILKLPTKCPPKISSLLLHEILNKLLHAVNLIGGANNKCQKFIQGDVDVLTEYYAITKPLAGALDILQRSAKNSDLGNLLPVLYSLKRTLSKFCDDNSLKHCRSLAKGFLTYIDERFQIAFANQQFIVASSIHPDYQFRFVKDNNELLKNCKDAISEFKGHCRCNDGKSTKDCEDKQQVEEVNVPEEYSFFDFPVPIPASDSTSTLSSNCSEDVADADADLKNCIIEYAESPLGKFNCPVFPKSKYTVCMKELYAQFNTGLASSAAVERVFSIGGDILRKKRNRLSDANFECCLKLKEAAKDKIVGNKGSSLLKSKSKKMKM